MSKKHMGSSVDDFLKEEGVFEEAQAQAVKEAVAWQLAEAMKKQDGRSVAAETNILSAASHRHLLCGKPLRQGANPHNDVLRSVPPLVTSPLVIEPSSEMVGGGRDRVIVISGIVPALEAPKQVPPLRLRARSGH